MKRIRQPIVISSVSFRGNLPIAGFQHIHIEATASVPAGVAPDVVLDELKKFVAAELKRAKDGVVEPVTREGRFADMLRGSLT